MDILDLADAHKPLVAECLEDWSPEVKEAGPRRARWIERFLAKGLRVKLAVHDSGAIGGMVQFLPIEHWPVQGRDLHFVPCIWVHGHRQGRGNFQGRGMGSALLEAAEADARRAGAKGMAAWGVWLPFWMKASWFKKHGYRKADRDGLAVLVWKPFTEEAEAPRWLKLRKKPPESVPGKVTVTSFVGGWCTAGNLTAERARRAAAEFGDQVAYQEIDTSDRAAVVEWGHGDALFVDAKTVRTGPPPSHEKIRTLVARRVRRLSR